MRKQIIPLNKKTCMFGLDAGGGVIPITMRVVYLYLMEELHCVSRFTATNEPAELFITTPIPTTTPELTTTTTASVLELSYSVNQRIFKSGGMCTSSIKVTARNELDCGSLCVRKQCVGFSYEAPDCYLDDPNAGDLAVAGNRTCYIYV